MAASGQMALSNIKSIQDPVIAPKIIGILRGKGITGSGRNVEFLLDADKDCGGRGKTEYTRTPARKSHTKRELPEGFFDGKLYSERVDFTIPDLPAANAFGQAALSTFNIMNSRMVRIMQNKEKKNKKEKQWLQFISPPSSRSTKTMARISRKRALLQPHNLPISSPSNMSRGYRMLQKVKQQKLSAKAEQINQQIIDNDKMIDHINSNNSAKTEVMASVDIGNNGNGKIMAYQQDMEMTNNGSVEPEFVTKQNNGAFAFNNTPQCSTEMKDNSIQNSPIASFSFDGIINDEEEAQSDEMKSDTSVDCVLNGNAFKSNNNKPDTSQSSFMCQVVHSTQSSSPDDDDDDDDLHMHDCNSNSNSKNNNKFRNQIQTKSVETNTKNTNNPFIITDNAIKTIAHEPTSPSMTFDINSNQNSKSIIETEKFVNKSSATNQNQCITTVNQSKKADRDIAISFLSSCTSSTFNDDNTGEDTNTTTTTGINTSTLSVLSPIIERCNESNSIYLIGRSTQTDGYLCEIGTQTATNSNSLINENAAIEIQSCNGNVYKLCNSNNNNKQTRMIDNMREQTPQEELQSLSLSIDNINNNINSQNRQKRKRSYDEMQLNENNNQKSKNECSNAKRRRVCFCNNNKPRFFDETVRELMFQENSLLWGWENDRACIVDNVLYNVNGEPEIYALLWLDYVDTEGARKGKCSITYDSIDKVENKCKSMSNEAFIKYLETQDVTAVAWKEIRNRKPQFYKYNKCIELKSKNNKKRRRASVA